MHPPVAALAPEATHVRAAPGSALQPGMVIGGRYVLDAVLGRGGMSSVWAARHATLGSRCAVKLLDPSVVDSAEARARFEREARLSATLSAETPHIVRVFDHGVEELATGPRPYLVMDLVEGRTLRDIVEEQGRLPLVDAAELVRQIAVALDVIHARGVVHRDLKPSNVLIVKGASGAPQVRLIDFGIAKAALQCDLTRTGAVLGTPSYISPEQVSSPCEVDARADVWGLTALAYHLAVGAPPFGTGTFEEVLGRVLWARPQRPSAVVPELPASFDRWVSRGLERVPAHRFQSAGELAAALEILVVDSPAPSSLCVGKGGSALSEEAPTVREQADAAALVAVRPRRLGVLAGRRAMVVLGLATSALLAGIVLLRGWARDPPRDAPPAQPISVATRAVVASAPALDTATPPAVVDVVDAGPVASVSPPRRPAHASAVPAGSASVANARRSAAPRARDTYLDWAAP